MADIDWKLLGIVNVVRRNKGLPELSELRGDHDLRDDMRFDSLDIAELTVRIEDLFGVDVFEEGVVRRWSEIRARVKRHASSTD